jgi:hypothetical protein
MERIASSSNLPFGVVQCSSSHTDKIKNTSNIQDGILYFVLDSK